MSEYKSLVGDKILFIEDYFSLFDLETEVVK
jgi:hypothetical protein